MAKAWKDSPYLFIVNVQPMFRGDNEDVGPEQLNFAFTSESCLCSGCSQVTEVQEITQSAHLISQRLYKNVSEAKKKEKRKEVKTLIKCF